MPKLLGFFLCKLWRIAPQLMLTLRYAFKGKLSQSIFGVFTDSHMLRSLSHVEFLPLPETPLPIVPWPCARWTLHPCSFLQNNLQPWILWGWQKWVQSRDCGVVPSMQWEPIKNLKNIVSSKLTDNDWLTHLHQFLSYKINSRDLF